MSRHLSKEIKTKKVFNVDDFILSENLSFSLSSVLKLVQSFQCELVHFGVFWSKVISYLISSLWMIFTYRVFVTFGVMHWPKITLGFSVIFTSEKESPNQPIWEVLLPVITDWPRVTCCDPVTALTHQSRSHPQTFSGIEAILYYTHVLEHEVAKHASPHLRILPTLCQFKELPS